MIEVLVFLYVFFLLIASLVFLFWYATVKFSRFMDRNKRTGDD